MADRMHKLDPTAFRSALARFPSGITIVTTRSEAGTPPGGDHVILIGRVHEAGAGSGEPVTWYRGGFRHLGERAA